MNFNHLMKCLGDSGAEAFLLMIFIFIIGFILGYFVSKQSKTKIALEEDIYMDQPATSTSNLTRGKDDL